jgi:hypothetical protein
MACAASAQDVPQGVWEGTLGGKPVVACFNAGLASGSYFYKQYKRPIQLTRAGADAFWHEDKDTGLWSLDAPHGTTLTGTWRSPGGQGAALPIALTRVDSSQSDSACAADSYAGRLEAAPKLETGKKTEFAPGRSFRKLRYAGQETVELFGPEPSTGAIDRELHADLDMSPDTLKAYFAKRREFLGQTGFPAEDENTADIDYWTSQFLSIRSYTWAAGTGRNGISWIHRNWDLRSGKQIDLWSWLGPRRKDSGSYGSPSPALMRFLFRAGQLDPATAEDNCKANYEPGQTYELTLEDKGLRFSQPAYGTGCEIDVEVPYEDLGPVLSASGKAAVERILKNPR